MSASALISVARMGRFVHGVVFGRKNLFMTNAIVSTAMGALGDGIQQRYDILMNLDEDGNKRVNQPPPTYNWTRTAHMSAAGFTTGVLSHFWYILLDKKMGTVRNLIVVTKKVLIDQILFSPVNLFVYFSTVGICERSSITRVKDELMEKGMGQIYVVEWAIWPPAQYFNFYVLPLRYRIMFDNIISLGFDIYSPYIKYKTELKKEREARLLHKMANQTSTITTPPSPSL